MISKMIDNIAQIRYALKAGTRDSYYWQAGQKILPNRLSWRTKNLAPTRNKRPKAGQLQGKFTHKEMHPSPYKLKPRGKFHTTIFKTPFEHLLGYSDIARETEKGKYERTKDCVSVAMPKAGILDFYVVPKFYLMKKPEQNRVLRKINQLAGNKKGNGQ